MSLSLAIRGSWPSISTGMQGPFLLSLLLLLHAEEKGRAALQREANRLVLMARWGGFPTGVGGCGLGLCSVWHGFPRPFSSLKERDGGGCGCVLLQRSVTQCSSDWEESLRRTIAIICFSSCTKVFVTGFHFSSHLHLHLKSSCLLMYPTHNLNWGTFFFNTANLK